MEPVYYVSYYLELQKQLAASKKSFQKPLFDVPADQERHDHIGESLELRSISQAASLSWWSVRQESG